jgi:hypothetical protein
MLNIKFDSYFDFSHDEKVEEAHKCTVVIVEKLIWIAGLYDVLHGVSEIATSVENSVFEAPKRHSCFLLKFSSLNHSHRHVYALEKLVAAVCSL